MLRTLWLCLILLLPGVARADTLAVLYFENGGGPQYEALKVGLAQMLISDLVGTEGVTVVERTALQAVLDELELGHSGMVDPDSAARVGKLLGARWMVLGTYFELGGTLFVQSRLVEVETGRIVKGFSLQDAPADFLKLEQELARSYEALLAELRPAPPPSGPAAPARRRGGEAEEASVVAPDPEALEAAIAFSEGLIHLDGRDVTRAREAFEQALVKDPGLQDAKAQLASLEL